MSGEDGAPMTGLDALLGLVAAVLLLTWPYIELGVSVPLGGWTADAPLADLAALALVPLAAWRLLRGRWPTGAVGYAGLVAAGLLGALAAADPGPALHELVRRPVFFGLAYGVGFAGFVASTAHVARLRRALAVAVGLCAVVSLATSVGRIVAGDALWFHAIAGLTNNHKTLAVAMAPTLPLLWGWPAAPGERRVLRAVVALAAVALVASVSRTAWISAGLAATFFLSWGGRLLAERRALLPALVLGGVLASTYGPVLTRSITQMDAMRSRHSIDKRSWHLFVSSPLVGAGPGASVRTELVTFPDYRVNGVDAHGVIQKVAAEYGVLGLAGYGAFVAALARRVRARHRPGDGAWPAFLALHTNLLLSTEAFTQTHWTILALVVGLAERRPDDAEAAP